MPLVRIDLRRGKSPAYKKAICDGIYRALRETFNVPENDRFMIVNEHDAGNFDHADLYLGISYSDDLVIIQITVSNTRATATKQALFARIAPCLRKARAYVRKT
jgi:4-oxalocrotonate tautomerase